MHNVEVTARQTAGEPVPGGVARGPNNSWVTVRGTITFDQLRESVSSLGITLTNPRRPARRRDPDRPMPSAPDTVSLAEFQRDGFFPRPTNTRPGRYHPAAGGLIALLVSVLGRRHGQDDPRRIARGRPEREDLRARLQEKWQECRRIHECAEREGECEEWEGECKEWEDIVTGLRSVLARGDLTPGQRNAIGNDLAEARAILRRWEEAAEDAFYSWAGSEAKEADYRTEARGRPLEDVVDEVIVNEARIALSRAVSGKKARGLGSIDLATHEVLVTFVLRPGPDGRPTSRIGPPAAQVRRRS